jgi:murein DD-endopeptidase MepM/ murein hydrolase activator NlpD
MLFSTLQNALASYTLRQYPLNGDQQNQVVSVLSSTFSVNLADFSAQTPHLSPILTPAQMQKAGPDKIIASPKTHIVSEGETLSEIATRYNLHMGSIVLANPQLKDTSLIEAGEQLTIPDVDAPANALSSEARLRLSRNANVAYADTKMSLPPIVQQISQVSNIEGLMWPMRGLITQRFSSSHSGIDIATTMGTPIVAAADGQVLSSLLGYNGGYGNSIWLLHPSLGLATHYAHLSYYIVHAGDIVKRGQTIGYEGSTGYSTGPHLHFEVKTNSLRNPLSYLP